MGTLRLHGVVKAYQRGAATIGAIDMTVDEGECFVLVGPSGCGKSTLLRLIAGLDHVDSGRIEIDGIDVTELPPQQRDVAMVFQSYALYPHMTVRQNLAYGLRARREPRASIESRVLAAARGLGLESMLDRYPAQLSGGERQRVALGRAIVRTPRLFLFDEPLSNLDPALRTKARAELRRLHRTLGATIVHVTHDQEEAMTLGDRIGVMRSGRLEQMGTPGELYSAPVNTFVATFIGGPAMNLLPAGVAGGTAPPGAIAGIRPHHVRIEDAGPLAARVDLVEPRGPDTLVHLRLIDRPEIGVVAVVATAAPRTGEEVSFMLPPEHVHLFDANGRRLPSTAATSR